MNAKIKKINAEYEKNAAKIADLQARQKGTGQTAYRAGKPGHCGHGTLR